LIRRHVIVSVLVGGALSLTACSFGPGGSAASSSASAPTSSGQAATDSALPTDTAEVRPPDTATGGGDETTTTESEGPSASPTTPDSVPTELADTPLGLSRAQRATGEWEESRYEIADRSDVPGMGVVVDCTVEENAPQLEYRLANRFNALSLTVSQANSSESSDQQLTIRILGNESQLDVQKVPFNKVKPLKVDVRGVNALKIRLFLDREEGCTTGNESVVAVIEDLKVN
jgi:hypothetical protein